jgi:hypothetical protein
MEEERSDTNTNRSITDAKTGTSKKKKYLLTVIAFVLIVISFFKIFELQEKSYTINYLKDGSYNTFAPISSTVEKFGDFIKYVVYTVLGLAGLVILLIDYLLKRKKGK